MSRKKTVVNKLLKKAKKANKSKQKSNKPRYISKAEREQLSEQESLEVLAPLKTEHQ